MKKYLLAAALVMASTAVMADRMVTTRGSWNGATEKEACSIAKQTAVKEAEKRNEQVESYGECTCSVDYSNWWNCTIDVKVEKKQ